MAKANAKLEQTTRLGFIRYIIFNPFRFFGFVRYFCLANIMNEIQGPRGLRSLALGSASKRGLTSGSDRPLDDRKKDRTNG